MTNLNQLKKRIDDLQDVIKNGIQYNKSLDAYILHWTKKQVEDAEKEADEIYRALNNEIEDCDL